MTGRAEEKLHALGKPHGRCKMQRGGVAGDAPSRRCPTSVLRGIYGGVGVGKRTFRSSGPWGMSGDVGGLGRGGSSGRSRGVLLGVLPASGFTAVGYATCSVRGGGLQQQLQYS